MSFYNNISDYYHQIFPLNRLQVSFVVESFTETGKKDLLDIGCGIGELSFELSKHFQKVNAVDLDESMITKAKKDFGKKAANLQFQELNMLAIEKQFGKNSFDAIISFGNTLVHLKDAEHILAFFKQAKEVLKDKGKLLFQIINYDRIFDQKVDFLPTIENEHIRFERRYRLHSNRKLLDFETILTIVNNNQRIENLIQLYPIRKKEINQLLTEAGFKEIKYYSSFKKEFFKPDSMPLIVEAN